MGLREQIAEFRARYRAARAPTQRPSNPDAPEVFYLDDDSLAPGQMVRIEHDNGTVTIARCLEVTERDEGNYLTKLERQWLQ